MRKLSQDTQGESTISHCRFPPELNQRVESEAKRRQISKSELIRRVLAEHLIPERGQRMPAQKAAL